MSESSFWLVWCPTGSRPPSRRHMTLDAAQVEAERLARNEPKARFYVLKAVSAAQKVDVITTPLCSEGEGNTGLEMPF